MKISVVIATCNRPGQLSHCLNSLIYNTYKQFEIIVVDQSENNLTRETVRLLRNKLIKYYKLDKQNKSNALNLGVSKAKGEIIALTDDDCLTDKNWLEQINKTYKNNPRVSATTGKVIPYRKHHQSGKICPSYFIKKKPMLIKQPTYHSDRIGMGNNFTFLKHIFLKCGGFRSWFGPGSISRSGEDAEYMMRLLINGFQILYNPEIVIFHDRWVSHKQHIDQNHRYILGEAVCYSYYLFNSYRFAYKIIVSGFISSFKHLFKAVLFLLNLKRAAFLYYANEFYNTFLIRSGGLFVGLYYAIKDPVIRKS